MLKCYFIISLLFIFNSIYGQNNEHPIIPANGTPELLGGFRALTQEEIDAIPDLNIKTGKRNSLPYRVDNSENKYFRGIIMQEGGSCSQASGVAYIFTYEINFLRDLDSKDPVNQYPSHFTYNFLNKGSGDKGSNYTDGWRIIKESGCPNLIEYGGLYPIGNKGWLSGYDKYYRAMFNRTIEYYKIDVGNAEGLQQLKQYLFDHGNGSDYGGIVNFSAGVAACKTRVVAMGEYEEQKKVVFEYSNPVDHAMTFVGYDDSICFDFNGDGQYTNNIDINNDGVVDMKDWEIGAMIVANTWGTNWVGGNNGKVYCPYRLLAYNHNEGGISNSQVFVVIPEKEYEPQLTAKIKLKHNMRSKIEISVGVSEDITETEPAYEFKYKAFDNAGGAYPMDGYSDDSIEIGLDLRPLLEQNKVEVYKIFLKIKESDKDGEAEGMIHNFSVIDYRNGHTEYVCHDSNAEIKDHTNTYLSVVLGNPPAPPYDLTATTFNKDSVFLSWDRPNTPSQPVSYEVYMNNTPAITSSDTFAVHYFIPNGTKYKVKAVYSGNLVSPPSNTIFVSGIEEYPVASSGSALEFDGVNDCINCGDQFDLAKSNFTIEFWAKRSPNTSNQFVIGHGKVKSSSKGLHIGFRSNKLMCGFWGDDVHTDESFLDEDWHHWAITYDTNTYMQTIYRDGIIAGQREADTHYLGTGDLYIGCMTGDRWRFEGQLDEIRIWNRLLSAEEIIENMYRPVTLDEEGLAAYYNFDERVGNIVYDQSTNNHTGAFENMDNFAWTISHAWQHRKSTPNLEPITIFTGYLNDSISPAFELIQSPNQGKLSFGKDSTMIIYTPEKEFYGLDSLDYELAFNNKLERYKIYIHGTLIYNSINDMQNDVQLSVYPQPATYYFLVESIKSEIQDIDIYNVNGNLIFTKNNLNRKKFYFDTKAANLNAGIYFLKVRTGNEVFTKEIIIVN